MISNGKNRKDKNVIVSYINEEGGEIQNVF